MSACLLDGACTVSGIGRYGSLLHALSMPADQVCSQNTPVLGRRQDRPFACSMDLLSTERLAAILCTCCACPGNVYDGDEFHYNLSERHFDPRLR